MKEEIFEFINSKGPKGVTVNMIAEKFSKSTAWGNYILKDMLANGKVKKVGKFGKSQIYVSVLFLDAATAEIPKKDKVGKKDKTDILRKTLEDLSKESGCVTNITQFAERAGVSNPTASRFLKNVIKNPIDGIFIDQNGRNVFISNKPFDEAKNETNQLPDDCNDSAKKEFLQMLSKDSLRDPIKQILKESLVEILEELLKKLKS